MDYHIGARAAEILGEGAIAGDHQAVAATVDDEADTHSATMAAMIAEAQAIFRAVKT